VTDGKYAKNVVPLKYVKGRDGEEATHMNFMTGDKMGGMELNFVIEVYDETGNWPQKAHYHSFDECLVFFGEGEDFNYLGADMSISMGKEYEGHKFSVPTVIAVPANVPHNPLVRDKVYNKFGHLHIACSSKYGNTWVNQEGTTDGKKYDYLFHTMKAEKGKGGADATQLIPIEGARDMAGVPLNFKLGIHNGTGEFYPGKGSLIHSYDSVVVFFGRKTDDPTYLGAEISIEIGQEHEKHTFDVPSVVWLPKGTPHFPVSCNRCDHAYTVAQIGLSCKYDAKWVK
jgi:hypothetical protein